MATSQQYQFGTSTKLDNLFRDAFERVGIVGNLETGVLIESAIMSANLLLSEWQGKVPLQFLRKMQMFQLYANQTSYNLPIQVTQVLDVVVMQPKQLNTGGVATASSTPTSGSAYSCFLTTPTTGCVLSGLNQWIQYSYPESQTPSIAYIGIEVGGGKQTYKINIEYSFDNVNWIVGEATPLIDYYTGQPQWWVFENTVGARYWRIYDDTPTRPNPTFNIKSIRFCMPNYVGVGNRTLLPISESQYVRLTNLGSSGFPSSYFFNAQNKPYIKLWPLLNPNFAINNTSVILYTAYLYSADVIYLFQNVDLPLRFYKAFVCGLSYDLAQKMSALNIGIADTITPGKMQMLQLEAQSSFEAACKTDAPNYSIEIQPDLSSYWV